MRRFRCGLFAVLPTLVMPGVAVAREFSMQPARCGADSLGNGSDTKPLIWSADGQRVFADLYGICAVELADGTTNYDGSSRPLITSKDGRLRVSHFEFDELVVTDVNSGRVLARREMPDVSESSPILSDDGAYLAVTDYEGVIQVLETATLKSVVKPLKNSWLIGFRPGTSWLVILTSDSRGSHTEVLDASTGKLTGWHPKAPAGSVHWSPDGSIYVSMTSKGLVARTLQNKVLWRMRAEEEFESWSPDGKRLLVFGEHGMAMVDAANGHVLHRFDDWVSTSFMPDGHDLLVSGQDLSRLDDRGMCTIVSGDARQMSVRGVSADGRFAAVAYDSPQELKIVSLQDGHIAWSEPLFARFDNVSVAWSPTGHAAFAYGIGDTVYVVKHGDGPDAGARLPEGLQRFSFAEFVQYPSPLRWSAKGTYAWRSDMRHGLLVDVSRGISKQVEAEVEAVSPLEDSAVVTLNEDTDEGQVVSLPEWRTEKILPTHGIDHDASYSSDGQLVYSAATDSLYETGTWELACKHLRAHAEVFWRPDNHTLLTADRESSSTSNLFDPATCSVTTTVNGTPRFDGNPWSADGQAFVTVTPGRLLFWSAEGQPTGELQIIDERPLAVWSPDAQQLAVLDRDGFDLKIVGRRGELVAQARFDGMFGRISWRPDGKMLVASVIKPGRHAAFILLGADLQPLRTLAEEGVASARWSKDGRWLSYITQSTSELRVLDARADFAVAWQLDLQHSDSRVSWSPGGTYMGADTDDGFILWSPAD